MNKTKIAAGAVAIIALVSACKQEPEPGRVAVTGDSVTFQSLLYAGNSEGWDTSGKVGLGWRAEHAQPRVTDDVHGQTTDCDTLNADGYCDGTSPEILTIVFGHNYRSGFGVEQEAEVEELANTPHENACVVIVLPHYTGDNATHAQAIEDYRDWAVGFAPTRGRTVTSDWRPVAEDNPEHIWTDGIHLPMEAEWYEATDRMIAAGEAYQGVIQSGIEQC